ncbi:MAG: hypothetical protein AAF850_04200 [Pseudomonadota bacterium]
MRLFFAAAFLATLAACATSTPYAPADQGGGYGFAEQRIEDDRFRITFRGNSLTTRETVENFLLYRAAEVTLANGFDYFVVVEGDTETRRQLRSSTFANPGFGAFGGPAYFGRYPFGFPGRFYAFPYYAYGFGWGAPFADTVTREITRYSAVAFVMLARGEKPEDNPQAFDARSVIENLRPVVLGSGVGAPPTR